MQLYCDYHNFTQIGLDDGEADGEREREHSIKEWLSNA